MCIRLFRQRAPAICFPLLKPPSACLIILPPIPANRDITMDPQEISKLTRAQARYSENCVVCRCARRQQSGPAFWLVKTFEGLCPFCRAYKKLHGRASHEPLPEKPTHPTP
jgi:hypothetical protein